MKNNRILYVLCSIFICLWCGGNAVLLLLSPLYVRAIYVSSLIPIDPYGLSRREQSAQALLTLTSLYPGINQEYTLSNLGMTSREIKHMIDVKNVVKLFLVTYGVVLFGLGYFVSVEITSIKKLQLLLRQVLLVTTGLLSCIAFSMIWFWDSFFTAFHTILFQPDTWLFAESDLLIRLFPEQFWVLSALSILGLIVVQLMVGYFFSHLAKNAFRNSSSKSV